MRAAEVRARAVGGRAQLPPPPPGRPSSPRRARLWAGLRGLWAARDWFPSTMLRPGAGPGSTKGALAARPSPSSADWGPRLQRPHSRPTPGHPVESPGPQRWCRVNFSYSPEQADELKLQAGEIVEVIKEVRG